MKRNRIAYEREYRRKNMKRLVANQRVYRKKYKERLTVRDQQYYKQNKPRIINVLLLRRYGITTDDYNNLFKQQKGKCFICLRGEREIVIDHDHKTGKVRGLLCNPCNKSFYLFDNKKYLNRALEYLRKPQ